MEAAPTNLPVIPAQTGIYMLRVSPFLRRPHIWIPALAGMTGEDLDANRQELAMHYAHPVLGKTLER